MRQRWMVEVTKFIEFDNDTKLKAKPILQQEIEPDIWEDVPTVEVVTEIKEHK